MKHYYCTLFDSHYFFRGLALYESLKRSDPNFVLYIFAFDDITYKALLALDLEHVVLVSLQEFEDPQLLGVKPYRNVAEYCWTSTPSTLLFCLQNYQLPHCVYVDADIYFFSNPQILFDEIGKKSVMITPHNFAPIYRRHVRNGIYNVQFVYFRNDEAGLQVLQLWRKQCIDWCYSRREDGKFGDQKYLDHWPKQFLSVHVLQNHHAALAPWNIEQYEIFSIKGKYFARHSVSGLVKPMVFYHFHNMRFYKEGYALSFFYKIPLSSLSEIYRVYANEIEKLRNCFVLESAHSCLLSKGFMDSHFDSLTLRFVQKKMETKLQAAPYLIIYNHSLFQKFLLHFSLSWKSPYLLLEYIGMMFYSFLKTKFYFF